MTHTQTERSLAWFTLAFAAIFAPIETTVSWKFGLLSPYYLVDAIGIVLLLWGSVRSLRRRPQSAPALMTVGWAWLGANFWRATLERQAKLEQGGPLDYGSNEIPMAIAMTALAMMCMGIGIGLILRTGRSQKETRSA